MTELQKLVLNELEYECIVWTCPNCRCEIVVDIDDVPMILDGEGAGVVELNCCPECGQVVDGRFMFGDWVVYDSGHTRATGRVTECRGRIAFVCYTNGCTAAASPIKHLRPATDEEIASASAGIGFHRFDETCPIRDEWVCSHCAAKKAGSENG